MSYSSWAIYIDLAYLFIIYDVIFWGFMAYTFLFWAKYKNLHFGLFLRTAQQVYPPKICFLFVKKWVVTGKGKSVCFLMSGSCHLDRASNVKIGVIFLNCGWVLQFGAHSRYFKGAVTQKRSFLVLCTTFRSDFLISKQTFNTKSVIRRPVEMTWSANKKKNAKKIYVTNVHCSNWDSSP